MENQIKELFVERILSLEEKIPSPKQKILNDPDVKDTLSKLHADFVLVPADKAANNVRFVYRKYYVETSIKELCLNSISSNSAYMPSTDVYDEILKTSCLKRTKIFLICTGLQNRIWSLLNIDFLLAPVNVP